MRTRDAETADRETIRQIHAQNGIDYSLPDLDSPLFCVRKVVEDDNGRVVGACFLRLTAETYLMLSPELTPRDKVTAMQAMQPEVLRSAWELGLDEVEARIPAEIEARFHKRLRCLGWSRNREGWHPWTIATHA